MDRRTGKPAQWDSLPEDVQRSIPERRALRTESNWPYSRCTTHASNPEGCCHSYRYLTPTVTASSTKRRKSLDNYGRSSKTIRNTIEFLSYRDSWTYLVSALRTLGLPRNSIDDALVQGTKDGRSPAMHDLIAAMPI